MILYGNELVKIIRSEFDNVKNRIWIAVPFIGNWNSVKKIMGTKWIHNNNVEMKIITDIRNDNFIDKDTIKQFLYRSKVRTLPGLHAKIYIIDNSVFITSANLTGTAFSKRYEICNCFNLEYDNRIEEVFINWWEKGKQVKTNWHPSTKSKSGNKENEAGNIKGLVKLWDLPQESIKISNFKDYQNNINLYNHFLKIYNSVSDRLLSNLSFYHELDAFFNYLFHEDENTPSHEYLTKQHRKLTDNQRILELKKYKNKFIDWLKYNPKFENYRKDRVLIVQEKLSKINIDQLNINNIEEVIDSLHTMNSHALNRYRFLNPRNNNEETIKNNFKILLHDNRPIEERMELCNKNLKYFGKSSIRELIL